MAEAWMIVDGYNLIARSKSLAGPTLELDRHNLARMFEPLLGDMAERITLVFDGHAERVSREADAGVEIVYSGGRLSADEVIVALIKTSAAPETILVIGSDRFVRDAAEAAGAHTAAAGIFLERLRAREAGVVRRVSKFKSVLGDIFPSLPASATKHAAKLPVRGKPG